MRARVMMSKVREDYDSLAVANGSPVWPVRTIDEEQMLRQAAEFLGLELDEVDAHPGNGMIASDEEVVAVGEEFRAECELYAHLTHRRARTVETLREVVRGQMPAVVLVKPDDLTSEVLEGFYLARAPECVPGLVIGRTRRELREAVLCCALAAMFPRKAALDLVHLEPEAMPSAPEQPGTLTSRGARLAATRRAARAGASILVVVGHGDGVDAMLGGEAVLCSIRGLAEAGLDVAPGAGIGPAPACVDSGYCHRLKTSLIEAISGIETVAPAGIRASTLILDTCWGLPSQPSTVHASWTLALQLCRSPTVGAVLTPWRVKFRSDAAAVLSEELLAGQSVGRVVARYNALSSTRERGTEMCLIGDPRVRIEAGEGTRPVRNHSLGGRGSTVLSGGEVLFLNSILRTADATTGPDWKEHGVTARESLALYLGMAERCGNPDDWGIEGQVAASRMRNDVVRYLSARGTFPSKLWQQAADVPRRLHSLDAPCFACGQLTAVFSTVMHNSGYRRRLALCPQCGVVEDAALEAPARGFVVEHDDKAQNVMIRITGSWPSVRWAIGILVDVRRSAGGPFQSWPIAANGAPEPVCKLDIQLPPWLSTVALIAMDGLSMIALRQPVRNSVRRLPPAT